MKTVIFNCSTTLGQIIDANELTNADCIIFPNLREIAWLDKDLYDLNDISELDVNSISEHENFKFKIKEEKNFIVDDELTPCIVGTLYCNDKQLYPSLYAIIDISY